MDKERMSELMLDVQGAFEGTYEVWLGSTTVNHANVEVDWEVVVQRLLEYGWEKVYGVRVDAAGETSICNYYRQQDGGCRATRECEWEGCYGDRSKCPHKINMLYKEE